MKTWHTDGPFNPLGNGLSTLVRLVFGLGHIAGRWPLAAWRGFFQQWTLTAATATTPLWPPTQHDRWSMRAAQPRHIAAASATQTSSRTRPALLSLDVSRSCAVMAAVVMLTFTTGLGFVLYMLSGALTLLVSTSLFLPLALTCLRVVLQSVRNFFWEGLVLMLDRFGLTNYRKGGHLIAWAEIIGVRLEASRSATYLMLQFHQAQDMRAHFSLMRLLPAVLARTFVRHDQQNPTGPR